MRVLLVDDEEKFLDSMAERIRLLGLLPFKAAGGREAIEIAKNQELDLAIVDLKMPDMDGLVTIAKLKEIHPGLRTVLLTGFGGEKTEQATEALNSAYFEKDNMGGVWNFIKNLDTQSGIIIINPSSLSEQGAAGDQETRRRARAGEIEVMAARKTLEKSLSGLDGLSFVGHDRATGEARLIGETPVMQELKKSIAKVAVLDCTVLVRGETGTGKELVARAIHDMSPRRGNRFLAINCGSFSHELLSNELFGHEREAFTGAVRSKKGMFEAASGGTILLDEIGDTPYQMQVQLLRVLQEKTVIRVGGTDEIPVDIRILAATNQNLRKKVAENKFREDLYYRLNAFELRIPPLRKRRDDIAPLCSYFLDKFKRLFSKEAETVSSEVMSIFMDYAFPGNVRELENIIERTVILSDGRVVERHHLPERFQKAGKTEFRRRERLLTLAELERQYILEVLEATGGNRTRSAEVLGISRPALWRKLKRMGYDE